MISLSICIPVYRQVPTDLVQALEVQAYRCISPVDIIVMDDGSPEAFQSKLRQMRITDKTSVCFLSENVGRARIRNQLTARASGEYLLFLDGDSGVPDEDFLQRYLDCLPWNGVVCGGRIYPEAPLQPEWKLHWTYGRYLESRPAEFRNKQGYRSFMTNNFLISREIALEFPFNEALTTYGHEDTWFGYELSERAVPIMHIDNPVVHLELDPAAVFLEKTRDGLHNLGYLQETFAQSHPGFARSVTLLRTVNRFHKRGFCGWTGWWFWITKPWLEQNLLGRNPRLFAFQIYKLGYFCAFVAP